MRIFFNMKMRQMNARAIVRNLQRATDPQQSNRRAREIVRNLQRATVLFGFA